MKPLSWTRRVAVSLIPTIVLFGVGEGVVRLHYFYRNGRDRSYLITPLGRSLERIRKQAAYPYQPRRTYTAQDPCSGRLITFTVNSLGLRGQEWRLQKASGAFRVLAVGGSSTFGVNNPDDATWPISLERALLARYGRTIECLNAGQPGYALVDFTYFLREKLARYRPEMVIYYEGWNDTDLPGASQVHHNVRRFHQYTWVGRLSDGLYGRSLLYTYLLEKSQFYVISHRRDPLPNTHQFRAEVEEFIRTVRQQGARPVLVLQMMEPFQEARFRQFRAEVQSADLENRSELRQRVLALAKGTPGEKSAGYDDLTRLRLYQTLVLLEVVRRTGEALEVPVIDPDEEFVRAQGKQKLFCDVVHLSDRGNGVLAEAIASRLELRVK